MIIVFDRNIKICYDTKGKRYDLYYACLNEDLDLVIRGVS